MVGGVEVRRFEESVVQDLAVGGGQGAEFRHGIVRQVGCVRMLRVQTILEQLSLKLAVRAVQTYLRRLGAAGEGIHVKAGVRRHDDAVQAVFLRDSVDLLRVLGVQRRAIELPFRGALLGGREVYQPMFLVDSLDGSGPEIIHIPWTGREGSQQVTFVIVQVQVLVAVSSRRPDEFSRVAEKGQLAVQLDPGLAVFGQYYAALSRVDVGKQQIQLSLVPAFALNRESLAVGQPIDARQVDIGVVAQVNPGDGAGLYIGYSQTNQDIGAAGGGIALWKCRDIVGGDLEALGDFDGSLVDAGECDIPATGPPPVAGCAVHFLLGDKFSHAVLDGAATVHRQRLLLAFGDVVYMKILIANEGDMAACR